MGLCGCSVVYCLTLFFLVCLLHPNPTSASVIRQCFSRFNGSRCSKEEVLAYDCILRSIENSQDKLDVRTKLTTNIGVWKSNHAQFCTKWSKVTHPIKYCTDKLRQCTPVNTHSVDLCGRGGVHCLYHRYESCSINAGMIYGKFIHEMQSDICTETDLNRGLLPHYGPHLKCYQDLAFYSIDVRFPLDHFLQFCEKFEYNQLKNCIEGKLAPLSSDDLATDKTQFTNAAKSFLQETKQYCDSLLKIENSFLTKCRMRNVLECMQGAFNETPKAGYYIPCIAKQYSKCHAPIGAIIMGNGFANISPSWLSLMTLYLFFNFF